MYSEIGGTHDWLGTITEIIDSTSVKVKLDDTNKELVITHPVEYQMEIGLVIIVDIQNKRLGSLYDIYE